MSAIAKALERCQRLLQGRLDVRRQAACRSFQKKNIKVFIFFFVLRAAANRWSLGPRIYSWATGDAATPIQSGINGRLRHMEFENT